MLGDGCVEGLRMAMWLITVLRAIPPLLLKVYTSQDLAWDGGFRRSCCQGWVEGDIEIEATSDAYQLYAIWVEGFSVMQDPARSRIDR